MTTLTQNQITDYEKRTSTFHKIARPVFNPVDGYLLLFGTYENCGGGFPKPDPLSERVVLPGYDGHRKETRL
ncbi:MAG: hypothetical protein U5K69_11150 [Balneolaceae bacterium]|nr:hypothetical protein [Balneolaceae bacterium]